MLRILPLLLTLVACGTTVAPSLEARPAEGGTTEVSATQGSVRQIDVATLKADLDAGKVPLLVDVRTPGEYQQGHVAQARPLPLGQLEARLAELQAHKDQEIYLICQSGRRSDRAASLLAARGFKTVNVQGGTGGWMAAGHPVE